ncbi:MAG: MFS transporter [Candidatus Zixiibacteriota bacterium]
MSDTSAGTGRLLAGLRRTFRSLRHRNFRLFFIGQTISLIGTWMQQVAMSWLVYRLTDSAFLLGAVSFLGFFPSLVIAPFAGVLADRWNRYRLMYAIQVTAMLQALTLAALVLTGTVAVWHVMMLSSLLGLANAFDIPVRQAFMSDMLNDKDDLSNAIALNSSMVNSSRLIGPSLAGILIAAFGEGICFLANGLSYIAVLAALLAMRLPVTMTPKRERETVWDGLREGARYVYGFPPIRSILLLLSLVSLVGLPYTVLMPIFAKDILGGGPHTLGFLMSAPGIGALTGAIFLAARKNVRGLGRIIPLSAAIFGSGLILFSLSRMFWLSLVILFFTGFGMIVQMAASNTMLQTISDDDKRGRVMSFYTVAFRGILPFGSLMAGTMASSMGAPYTVGIGGAFCIIGAALFARQLPALRKYIRPVYLKKGIISELPTNGS